MRFLIITGMSGAGKSTVLKTLEDMDFFCVDNLPVSLIEKFSEISRASELTYDNVAIGIDIRNGKALDELSNVLAKLRDDKFNYEILYLDAGDDTLIRRYKETRREHPLARGRRTRDGIAEERERTAFLKTIADFTIDTSGLLTRELKSEVSRIVSMDKGYNNMIITVMSFGFKFGIPHDADFTFDARFLPNPYYDETLRPMTGNDAQIQNYVMGDGAAEAFLSKLYDMTAFFVPRFIENEDRHQIVIAIGCTGGRHRSVTIANMLAERLSTLPYSVRVFHRDIVNDRYVKGEI